MKKPPSPLVAAGFLLLLAGCDPRGTEPDQAAMAQASGAYRTCAGCHGAEGEGNAALQAPALVNLDDWYLQRQLENFRSGVRGANPKDTWGQQMAAQAALLGGADELDAVIRQIAAFPDRAPAATFEADADRGRDHYNMTCGACHGAGAIGNQALNAPSLRGIDDWYLLRQYSNFRDGIRGAHPQDSHGAQMRRMGQVLKTDQDARDVAAWLLSQGLDD
jgi:cytochrome c oxidase subunit 2